MTALARNGNAKKIAVYGYHVPSYQSPTPPAQTLVHHQL